MKYIEIFINTYSSYAGYLWNEITNPHLNNYFYWLLAVSLFFFIVEVIVPWRKNQAVLRKDFWLDFFYMFFNFFLFSLIIYNAASDVVLNLFNDAISFATGLNLKEINPLFQFPLWAILLIGFLVRDFVQWWIHRLLHRVEWLWNFHKVHHSVEEMGFAAHLRYHWMENVVYRTLEYIPLALLGIGLYDFFIIHIFTLAWGHYNHSNITVDSRLVAALVFAFIGFLVANEMVDIQLPLPLSFGFKAIFIVLSSIFGAFVFGSIFKKIFNSPEMHIWHHSYDLPDTHPNGINFGLTLSIWDYLFKTAHIPHNGKDIRLGFPGIEEFPESFIEQVKYGIKD